MYARQYGCTPARTHARTHGTRRYLTMLVNCMYWDARYPRLLTTEQMQAIRAAQVHRYMLHGYMPHMHMPTRHMPTRHMPHRCPYRGTAGVSLLFGGVAAVKVYKPSLSKPKAVVHQVDTIV